MNVAIVIIAIIKYEMMKASDDVALSRFNKLLAINFPDHKKRTLLNKVIVSPMPIDLLILVNLG